MPPPRELSLTYAGITVGGSSARQITSHSSPIKQGDDFEAGYFEFEFVTTATSEAAFGSELSTLRTAFRTPRQDLVVTQGSTTTLSIKHSNNTGLDTFPEILKDGDPVRDTGRSRTFRVRISYGLPADTTNTNFRRTSAITVNYDASRRRTVTITGTYTANSTDGTTASFAQYSSNIATYAATVLAGTLITGGTFEKIAEPDITRGETDKVMNFTVEYLEILYKQSLAAFDNANIVNPSMVVSREKEAPGDSLAGGLSFSSAGPFVNVGNTQAGPSGGSGGGVKRVTTFNLTYSCSVDSTLTVDLLSLWTGTIRPYLLQTANFVSDAGPVVIISEKFLPDLPGNQVGASMTFLAFPKDGTIIRQSIQAQDDLDTGVVDIGVYSKDPFEYYEFPGSAVRLRTVTEERDVMTTETDPNKIVAGLYAAPGSTVTGLEQSDKWVLKKRTPRAVSLRKGMDASGKVLGTTSSSVNVATIVVDSVLQYRNKLKPSTANAGGITGKNVTT